MSAGCPPHQETGSSAAGASPSPAVTHTRKRQLYVSEGSEQECEVPRRRRRRGQYQRTDDADDSVPGDQPQRRRGQYQRTDDADDSVPGDPPSPTLFVSEGLSFNNQMTQQYILEVLLVASKFSANTTAAAAAQEFMSRIRMEGLKPECVTLLLQQAQLHSAVYGVTTAVVEQLLATASLSEASTDAATCLLGKVFADLDVVWQEPSGERRTLLCGMSKQALQLLLSSSVLRANTEDLVLCTITESDQLKAQHNHLRDLVLAVVHLDQLSLEGLYYCMGLSLVNSELAIKLRNVLASRVARSHEMQVVGYAGSAAAAEPRLKSCANRTMVFIAPAARLVAALGALEQGGVLGQPYKFAASPNGRYPCQDGRRWQAQFVVIQSPIDASVEMCLDLDCTFPGSVSVPWSPCGISVDFLCETCPAPDNTCHYGPARFSLHSARNCQGLLNLVSGQQVAVQVTWKVDFGLDLAQRSTVQRSAQQLADVMTAY